MGKSWESLKKQLDDLQQRMVGNPLLIEIREYKTLGDSEVIASYKTDIDGVENIVNDIESRGQAWNFRVLEGNNVKEVKRLLDFIEAGIKEDYGRENHAEQEES